uniref:Uncharacterized protein n=1 Tax=Hyaloperonospora arabidopsidis (strain Emoy2) TaxID=559515 RepID=M4BGZ9_HYAAE
MSLTRHTAGVRHQSGLFHYLNDLFRIRSASLLRLAFFMCSVPSLSITVASDLVSSVSTLGLCGFGNALISS